MLRKLCRMEDEDEVDDEDDEEEKVDEETSADLESSLVEMEIDDDLMQSQKH